MRHSFKKIKGTIDMGNKKDNFLCTVVKNYRQNFLCKVIKNYRHGEI